MPKLIRGEEGTPKWLRDQITTHRERAGLSKAKCAQLMGVSRGYLTLIEQGRRSMSLPAFLKFCQVVHTPAAVVLGEISPDTWAALRRIWGTIGVESQLYFGSQRPEVMKEAFVAAARVIEHRTGEKPPPRSVRPTGEKPAPRPTRAPKSKRPK